MKKRLEEAEMRFYRKILQTKRMSNEKALGTTES